VSETSAIVAETAARIFEDLADPQTVNQAKDESWQAPLWSSLEESGLTLAWVPDTLGGAGAALSDGFEVVKVAGRFAATVPLAGTLLAWVCVGFFCWRWPAPGQPPPRLNISGWARTGARCSAIDHRPGMSRKRTSSRSPGR